MASQMATVPLRPPAGRQSPIGAEGDPEDRIVDPLELVRELPRRIVDPRDATRAPDEQRAAVRGLDHIGDPRLPDHLLLGAVRGVPEANRAVLRAADDASPVGGEHHRPDDVAVTAERVDSRPGDDVPDEELPVHAARHQSRPRGIEGHVKRPPGVRGQGLPEAARRHVPELDRSVVARRRRDAPVGAERRVRDLLHVTTLQHEVRNPRDLVGRLRCRCRGLPRWRGRGRGRPPAGDERDQPACESPPKARHGPMLANLRAPPQRPYPAACRNRATSASSSAMRSCSFSATGAICASVKRGVM